MEGTMTGTPSETFGERIVLESVFEVSIKVFQACDVVSIMTGGMFLRITQNVSLSKRLSRSGALTSACLLVHVGRAVVFLQCCDFTTSHA